MASVRPDPPEVSAAKDREASRQGRLVSIARLMRSLSDERRAVVQQHLDADDLDSAMRVAIFG